MVDQAHTLTLNWEGPFAWPGFESVAGLPSLPQKPGVYLQTFEYQNGFLIYLAGITHRPVSARFKDHTRKYLNGEYNVLDIDAARRGVRKEVWHGWGYARAHREEFEARKPRSSRLYTDSWRAFASSLRTWALALESSSASRLRS